MPIIEKSLNGPKTVLTTEEEETLVLWLEMTMRAGFPRPDASLLDEVQKIILADGRPHSFVNGRPGRKWLRLFLIRHPEISYRTPESVQKAR